MAHIIVVGNEKGGAGKSTVTMHLATALSRMGHRVAGLDLDLRQQTFARYCLNRKKYQYDAGLSFPSPQHFSLPEIEKSSVPEDENIYDHRLSAAIVELEHGSDCI